MRFCSLKVENLVLEINLVNRRWVVYTRTYGIFMFNKTENTFSLKARAELK